MSSHTGRLSRRTFLKGAAATSSALLLRAGTVAGGGHVVGADTHAAKGIAIEVHGSARCAGRNFGSIAAAARHAPMA